MWNPGTHGADMVRRLQAIERGGAGGARWASRCLNLLVIAHVSDSIFYLYILYFLFFIIFFIYISSS
jgi:hypothetical protein